MTQIISYVIAQQDKGHKGEKKGWMGTSPHPKNVTKGDAQREGQTGKMDLDEPKGPEFLRNKGTT